MVFDPTSYPDARLNRAGPSPATAGAVSGAGLTFPSTTTWPFRITVGANQRSTRSMGPFRGPGMVKQVEIEFQSVAGAFSQWCEVGYNATAVSESLIAASAARTWQSFFRRLPVQGTDLDSEVLGHFTSTDLTQVIRWPHDLSGIVTLSEWFCVVSVGAGGATGIDVAGLITIVEGISPQALANFL